MDNFIASSLLSAQSAPKFPSQLLLGREIRNGGRSREQRENDCQTQEERREPTRLHRCCCSPRSHRWLRYLRLQFSSQKIKEERSRPLSSLLFSFLYSFFGSFLLAKHFQECISFVIVVNIFLCATQVWISCNFLCIYCC